MIFWTVSHDLVEIHDLGCHSLSWMNRALGGFIRPTHMARQNISIVSEFKGKFARFFVQIWEVFDVTKMGENSMERIVFKFYIHGSIVNFQNVYWRCVIPIKRIPYERWYHHPLQLEGVFFFTLAIWCRIPDPVHHYHCPWILTTWCLITVVFAIGVSPSPSHLGPVAIPRPWSWLPCARGDRAFLSGDERIHP